MHRRSQAQPGAVPPDDLAPLVQPAGHRPTLVVHRDLLHGNLFKDDRAAAGGLHVEHHLLAASLHHQGGEAARGDRLAAGSEGVGGSTGGQPGIGSPPAAMLAHGGHASDPQDRSLVRLATVGTASQACLGRDRSPACPGLLTAPAGMLCGGGHARDSDPAPAQHLIEARAFTEALLEGLWGHPVRQLGGAIDHLDQPPPWLLR
jgi:hypothetical protein